jgi:long-chain acyl-CoA synthetase
MPIIELEDQPYLKGKQLEFDSVSEMFVQRTKEIPDTLYVKFYDQKITPAMRGLSESNKASFSIIAATVTTW